MEKSSIISNVRRFEMLDEDIKELKLKEDIEQILKKNKIKKIEQLTRKTKSDLKDIGLLGYQISEIEIKLQLEGYDLKGNY